MLKVSFFSFLVIFSSANLLAETSVWNPAANPSSTGLWSEAANWTTNAVPGATTKVVFNVPDARECILDVASTISQFVLGDNGLGGTLRVANGGNLTTTAGWSGIGWNTNATLIVETGATVTFAEHMWIGWSAGCKGTVILNGGTIAVPTGMFGMNFESAGGTGLVSVNSGVLQLGQFHATQSIPAGSVLDILAGKVEINGDVQAIVTNYITSKRIKAYGGSGTINVDVSGGITTITATAPTAVNNLALGASVKINVDPTTRMLSVENSSKGNISFYIYSISGKVVYAKQNSNEQKAEVDLNGVSKGIYFIQVVSSRKSFTQKIIL